MKHHHTTTLLVCLAVCLLTGVLSGQPSGSIPASAETAEPKQDLGSAMQNPIGASS